jgi:hypothetical protein
MSYTRQGWGYPASDTQQQHAHLFPAYSSAIYNWMNFTTFTTANSSSSSSSSSSDQLPVGIGLTLVDGRFRVACAAAAGCPPNLSCTVLL